MNPVRRIYRRWHGLRRFIRRRKDALLYHLVRAVLWVLRQLSLPRALAIADRLGNLAYDALPKTRQLALDHLEIAFGQTKPLAERQAIARAALRNAARCFVELAKMEEIRPHLAEYASTEGIEHWEAVKSLERGAIVVTAHLGNWELLAARFATWGVPIAGVARRINDPRLNQLLVDARARNGVYSILRESTGSSREILNILKRRGILALILDQDIQTPSVSVPFFGRPARTPAAAASLAIRRDIPVIPAFIHRRPEGGHHCVLLPPIQPPHSGDRRRDIVELTHRFSQIIEEQVHKYPQEWVWWHRRWRRRPVPRLDLDVEIQYSKPVLP